MNGSPSARLGGRIPRRSGVAVAVALTLAACGDDGGGASTEPVVDGGDTTTEPAVDGGGASSQSVLGEDDPRPEPALDDGDASTSPPAYCDFVVRIAEIDFGKPTAVIEATVLNARYIVALVEEGPDLADELFADMVDLAERVGDIDPAALEPAVELFPFDDASDPALDDLDADVRQHADDLIAFQSMLNTADPGTGNELEAILEVECADALTTIELRTTDPGE